MKKTFAEYYADLQHWEGNDHRDLISTWDKDLIDAVKQDFAKAVELTGIKASVFLVKEGSSNQSIGNQVAVYTVTTLNNGLRMFLIENCVGSGYPDRVLASGNVKSIALEMKATSKWEDADSNRIVLTSSSAKLRKWFELPIYHLICTSIYTIEDWSITIGSLRLDFLEPTSDVNIRLEASVNHKILTGAHHDSLII